MKLSVVIPVFNTGHLVEKGIKSLLGITQVDLEIFCINDGSTDNSWDVLQELQTKYSNIILINKDNERVSATRNRGILEATGEYIYFMDSDDWVDTEKFNQLLGYCYEGYDIIHGNFNYVFENGEVKENKEQLEGVYSGQEFLCKGLLQDQVSMTTWVNIFKRDLLITNHLEFHTDIYQGEDEEFILRAFSYAQNIISKNVAFYMYLQRSGSVTHEPANEVKMFNDLIIIYNHINRFLQKSIHISNEYKKMCSTYVSMIILFSYAKVNNKVVRQTIKKNIIQLKLYKTIQSDNLLYKISKYALRIMPSLYITLLRIYFKISSRKV